VFYNCIVRSLAHVDINTYSRRARERGQGEERRASKTPGQCTFYNIHIHFSPLANLLPRFASADLRLMHMEEQRNAIYTSLSLSFALVYSVLQPPLHIYKLAPQPTPTSFGSRRRASRNYFSTLRDGMIVLPTANLHVECVYWLLLNCHFGLNCTPLRAHALFLPAAGRNILYPNARLSTPNCIFQSRKQFKGGARAPDK
jgi:hypothetical protein